MKRAWVIYSCRSLAVAAFAILLLTTVLIGQRAEIAKVPKVQLSLDAPVSVWKPTKPALTKVTVENIDTGLTSINLPTSVYFHVSGFPSPTNAFATSNSDLWSPVSLIKNYDSSAKSCQDDLSAERVAKDDKNGIVSIMPSPTNLALRKGEKKEFEFDLTRTCWDRSISSIYPSQDLFAIARAGKYKVYFEMEFLIGEKNQDGMKIPISEHIRSNEIEIQIN